MGNILFLVVVPVAVTITATSRNPTINPTRQYRARRSHHPPPHQQQRAHHQPPPPLSPFDRYSRHRHEIYLQQFHPQQQHQHSSLTDHLHHFLDIGIVLLWRALALLLVLSILGLFLHL